VEIISQTTDFHLLKDTAVAIGKFDGLHIGHQKLLDQLLSQKKNGLAVCIFTFEPAPAVLFGFSDGKELTVREEKRILFERMGVDILIEFPLDKATAAIKPETFLKEILVKRMKMRYLVAGRDLSFGAGGGGNIELINKVIDQYGFRTEIIEKVFYQGVEVSSTYIRSQIESGNMETVRNLLGAPYTIMGKVMHGKRLGRILGMPTVNLVPADNKLLPPCGVYYSQVRYRGKLYPSISNVGYKPTVTEEKLLGVESYLYNFQQEIYGDQIEVELLSFKRPEYRFENIDRLKAQLAMDISAGRDWADHNF